MSGLFVNGGADPVRRELAEGERLAGVVVRVPAPGATDGNRLLVRVDDCLVGIPATARKGWTVLERELTRAHVRAGDRISVHFRGWRQTSDGVRYRYVHVDVLERSDAAA